MPPRRNIQEKPPLALVVPLEDARAKISRQIDKGKQLRAVVIDDEQGLDATNDEYSAWHTYNLELLRQIANTDQLQQEYRGMRVASIYDRSLATKIKELQEHIDRGIRRLTPIYEKLELIPVAVSPDYQQHKSPVTTPVTTVEKICRRFHIVARQLRQRHSDRPTLVVNDEYDTQDLLHALLRVDFADVRPEETTPSYAGGSARVDFLLKAEQIIIEVKKTRQGLADREIGNELLEDIGRYKVHPDCRRLVCFVYDPESRVANPDGLEHDLSKNTDGVDVSVIVAPKGQ